MDCLWERDVCQPGIMVIGNWITRDGDEATACVCVCVCICLCRGELSE